MSKVTCTLRLQKPIYLQANKHTHRLRLYTQRHRKLFLWVANNVPAARADTTRIKYDVYVWCIVTPTLMYHEMLVCV